MYVKVVFIQLNLYLNFLLKNRSVTKTQWSALLNEFKWLLLTVISSVFKNTWLQCFCHV